MKAAFVLSLVAAVLIAQANAQALICAGAEGASTACAPACSNQCVNDDVSGTPNAGCFNVGGGNQGDANDGFNNVGNYNIGSSNLGDCSLGSGTNGGSCAVGTNNFNMVVRYCNVYPSKPACANPDSVAAFPAELKAQIRAVVASCNGVTVPSPPPATASPPPPTAVSPPPPTVGTPPPPAAPSPAGTPPPAPIAPSAEPFGVSDSTADLGTLLGLFAEHIAQEKAKG